MIISEIDYITKGYSKYSYAQKMYLKVSKGADLNASEGKVTRRQLYE